MESKEESSSALPEGTFALLMYYNMNKGTVTLTHDLGGGGCFTAPIELLAYTNRGRMAMSLGGGITLLPRVTSSHSNLPASRAVRAQRGPMFCYEKIAHIAGGAYFRTLGLQTKTNSNYGHRAVSHNPLRR